MISDLMLYCQQTCNIGYNSIIMLKKQRYQTAEGQYRWAGELALSAEDCFPLHDPGLDPDPLSGMSTFYGGLDHETEKVCVYFDCWPVPSNRMQDHRRAQIERLEKGSLLDEKKQAAEIKKLRTQMEGSLRTDNVAIRILIDAKAASLTRAQALVEAAADRFSMYNGDNQLRLDTRRSRQKKLTKWADAGTMSPAPKRPWIPVGWLRGVLTPATIKCGGQPLRAAPVAGLPPPMPTFPASAKPDPQYIPWGIDPRYHEDEEPRVLAVMEEETFFSWTGGSAGFGKSETSLTRFVYLAKAGHGCLFLDPHAHGSEKAKPYLRDVADRVVELALDGSRKNVVAWNPFDVPLLSEDNPSEDDWREELQTARETICGMFLGFKGWAGANADAAPRARVIFRQAVSALIETIPKLHREDRPNLFTVADLLDSEDLRDAIVEQLDDPRLAHYWTESYSKEQPNASLPITRPLLEFYDQPLVRALLGVSSTGFRIADLMDQRKVVLVRIGGDEDLMALVSSLLLFEVFHAMLRRRSRKPEDCPPFHMFLDEAQVYDGALKGMLAAAMEQCRKFGLRVHILNQSVMRLGRDTREALGTNRSHLNTSASSADSAQWVSTQTGGAIVADMITGLDKYEFVTEVTLNGRKPPPFNMGGLWLEGLFGPPPDDEGLQAIIDKNSNVRPVSTTLKELATLNDRIIASLQATPPPETENSDAGFDEVFGAPDDPIDSWSKLVTVEEGI